MNEFNLENARSFLEMYREIEPKRHEPRNSVKQVIFGLEPLIRELMEKGYTQRQILDLLKEEYDLKLEYGTFRNYLARARKRGAG